MYHDKRNAMGNFKERLMFFVKTQYDEGQKAFEERCGLSNGQINKMGNGANSSTLSKIAEICPQLNLRWLILGEGQMLNESSSSQSSLPLIPIEAFAGPGEPNYEDERIQDYYTVTDFKESDFLLRVKGDSMTPKYNGGDLVACKKVTDTYFIQWGRVYVIYTRSQGAMIKRIQPSDKDGWIKCVSENVKYAPFDVPMEDVVSVALVNGSISLE